MIDIVRDLPALGHVGYIVENVMVSAELFRQGLGIENFRIYDFIPDRAWGGGKELPDCALRIAIGSIKNDVKVELVQPISGDTPHARFLKEKGPGIHHIAFYSKEYEEWLDAYKSSGAQIVFEAETEDDIIGYRRSFYAQVPGMAGLIEITEIAHKRK